MNYVFILLFISAYATLCFAWECPAHLIMMQIAWTELADAEKNKITNLLSGMTGLNPGFTVLESACFHEDMTAAGATTFDLWKNYEFPFFDGIKEQDANFSAPLTDSLFAMVKSI